MCRELFVWYLYVVVWTATTNKTVGVPKCCCETDTLAALLDSAIYPAMNDFDHKNLWIFYWYIEGDILQRTKV